MTAGSAADPIGDPVADATVLQKVCVRDDGPVCPTAKCFSVDSAEVLTVKQGSTRAPRLTDAARAASRARRRFT
jgi:hypothetical protein